MTFTPASATSEPVRRRSNGVTVRALPLRRCKWDGRQFRPNGEGNVYCSGACKQAHGRERKRIGPKLYDIVEQYMNAGGDSKKRGKALTLMGRMVRDLRANREIRTEQASGGGNG